MQIKYNKNAKKKEKKKAKKATGGGHVEKEEDVKAMQDAPLASAGDLGVEIEYVADSMVDQADPLFNEWSKIFDHFQKPKKDEEVGQISHSSA